MIKPVNFHHFGKECKCKSHFDHRICIRIFSLQFGFCYLYSHLNCLSANITRYRKCKRDLTLGKDMRSDEELSAREVYDQNFYEGKGLVDGEGGSSER